MQNETCLPRANPKRRLIGERESIPLLLLGYNFALHEKLPVVFFLSGTNVSQYPQPNDAILKEHTFGTVLPLEIRDYSQEPLRTAQRDLENAMAVAHEEGFVQPSEIALANARRLLVDMYDISPRYYEVYPAEDGDISIDAPGGYNRSFVALCYRDGRVLCLANINGERKKRLYENVESLPDSFMISVLERLHQASDDEWLARD